MSHQNPKALVETKTLSSDKTSTSTSSGSTSTSESIEPKKTSSLKESDRLIEFQKRDEWIVTTNLAKNKIESRTKQLEKISSEILTNPDVANEEKETHKYMSELFKRLDCDVQSSYILPTAFRAVYPSGLTGDQSKRPTVGLICEYDAIKGFGHSNGHNLSTEAAVGALIGVREALKLDKRLFGKIVILGTPASEQKGGKIKMMRDQAFDNIDVILAIDPSNRNSLLPKFYCSQTIRVCFQGVCRHMEDMSRINGQNATDAAVLCYTNAMLLSNQMQPKYRIHCVIKRSPDSEDMVPKKTEVVFTIRAPELSDLDRINERVVDCGEAAAQATHTKVAFHFVDDQMYSHLNHNKIFANAFKEEAIKLGIDYKSESISDQTEYRTTDLGNVSFKLPVIKPSFNVGNGPDTPLVHTQEFATAVSKLEAQNNTIKISIAMAFTIIKFFLSPNLRQEIKTEFETGMNEMNRKFNENQSK